MYDDAAEWWERVRNGAPEDQFALKAWLDTDPAHQKAYDTIRANWDRFAEIQNAPEILDQRRKAIQGAQSASKAKTKAQVSRRATFGLVAAAAGAAVITPMIVFNSRRSQQSLGSQIGEQRTFSLADGSTLTLDANTHVEVDFDWRSRNIKLLRGRIHFDVAKDASRPFTVHATDNTVTAIGTAFTVEVRHTDVSVALFEGRVSIKAFPVTGAAVVLPEIKPGQMVAIAGGDVAAAKYTSVDEKSVLAWRTGQLIFDEEPLASVADRMNDYSSKKISVMDGAAKIKVSGTYLVGQSDTFLQAIEKFYPVRVKNSPDGIVISARAQVNKAAVQAQKS